MALETPQIAPRVNTTGYGRFLLPVCLILSGLLAYHFSSWAYQRFYRPSDSSGQKIVGTLLVISPRKIDFGTLKPGARKQKPVQVTNQGRDAVQIADIHIGCDCVQFHLPSNTLGPGEATQAQLIADFSSDPDFKGSLAVEVNGRTPSGESAFALTVYVNVFQDAS